MNKILIDISFVCFRAYFTHEKLSFRGIGSGMAYGVIQTLFYLMTKYKWNKKDIVLVWDGYPKWKYDLYPEYKSGRKKKEDVPEGMSISIQLKITKLLTTLLGFSYARIETEESDDVIASLAHEFKGRAHDVLIITNDHDFYQCLQDRVSIMNLHKEGEEVLTEEEMMQRSEIIPSDYWMVQVLGGCTTDKVPGMPGIGELSAQKICNLNNFRNVIMNDPSLKFPDKRTETVFRKNCKDWNYNRDYKLVKLKKDLCPEIKEFELNKKKLREWFLKLGFKNYLLPDNFQKLTGIFK